MSYVISADPGLTTGFALYDITDREDPKFHSGEEDWFTFCQWFRMWAAHVTPGQLLVVAEDFIITPQTAKKSRQTWSLEVIGVMKYTLREHQHPELVLQRPSDAKGFATNDRLKSVGWWTVGHQHANDAARHMMVFLISRPDIGFALDPLV